SAVGAHFRPAVLRHGRESEPDLRSARAGVAGLIPSFLPAHQAHGSCRWRRPRLGTKWVQREIEPAPPGRVLRAVGVPEVGGDGERGPSTLEVNGQAAGTGACRCDRRVQEVLSLLSGWLGWAIIWPEKSLTLLTVLLPHYRKV